MNRIGRPRKGESAIRRDQLLDHALRLFVERGYGNVSLETIAREARVSLRTIYRHFGGKADLFGAVIRHYSDLLAATLPLDQALARPLEETLVAFGTHFISCFSRPEIVRLRAQLIAEAHQFPELAAEFYEQGPQRTLERLAAFFAVHQEAGRLVAMDPTFLAGQFISALRGERFQRQQLGLEGAPTDREVEKWAKQTVRLFLQGCLSRTIIG
ncbi:transcriptional regulator, TetR family [Methylocaldum marinum]|uniref:Transcriptional regulator, TetR family n=1 Tax=Methylocaldum marinum TaxID=1432792 RepID=A0A250KP04_9GAMM|nr:TetR/AcrR family transcriptional regulator [Methylocaldum marinum]BBA33410.1 transcriptional regulator, TetR family [Methylocaldum marinum]